jgi:hypothetical protein
MPYKSKAQEAYFNANRDKMERQGVDVDEWNAASKGKSLPKRAAKPLSGAAHRSHLHKKVRSGLKAAFPK